MNENNSRERGEDKGARKRRRTRSFRHVSLERERPQLTKSQEKQTEQPTQKKETRGQRLTVNRDSKADLKVIPLGGLDAIGKNMTVFECKGDLLVDDAGLMFPDDEHPGIDLILPDYTYILENADKLRGIVITHGHEDHTGTLPYLLKDLDRQIPIYATKLTLGLIEGKFKEHRITNAKLIEIKSGQQVKIGCFVVDFFSVNHSIPDAVGLFLQSPAGNVLHTGDFKLDQTPVDKVHTDFAALASFGRIGVDLMMSDSTNAENQEFTPSEATVGVALGDIIARSKKRIIIAAFASHIHRLQQICDVAVANGRKVVVTGRSMVQNTDIARRLGYLKISDKDIIDAYYIKNTPPDKMVIMCTGSQGEPLSALTRIANGEHKTISIDEGDTVIISATPVPGNEKAVSRNINAIAKTGATIYDKSKAQVHVSGHAGAEELKLVLSIVQPKAFMPVHGEASHLQAHAKLAEAVCVPKRSVFVCENGDTLVLNQQGVHRGEPVTSGIVYVDGLSVGDTSQDVLDERTALSTQGVATVAAAVSMNNRKLLAQVAVEMHGITGGDDAELVDDAVFRVKTALQNALSKGTDYRSLVKECKSTVRQIMWERTKQRPMVVVNLLKL